jgi:hypothetical protein
VSHFRGGKQAWGISTLLSHKVSLFLALLPVYYCSAENRHVDIETVAFDYSFFWWWGVVIGV